MEFGIKQMWVQILARLPNFCETLCTFLDLLENIFLTPKMGDLGLASRIVINIKCKGIYKRGCHSVGHIVDAQ